MFETVETASAPMPVGAYSQAAISGGLVFTAGQIGINPQTGKLTEDLSSQVDQALNNLEQVLIEAGSGLDSVLRMNLYITDMMEFDIVNRIYSDRLQRPYPARSTVQVAALPLGALIEIDAIALVKGEYP